MSQRLLVEGQFVPIETEEEKLKRRARKLEDENTELNRKLMDAQKRCEQAMLPLVRLRRELEPIYLALKGVFGELDLADIVTQREASGHNPRASAVWESWKQKLGGKAAEFITELLVHGQMTGQQLKVATRCGQQTVYDTIAKLNKAQLLVKNGGKYSLRED